MDCIEYEGYRFPRGYGQWPTSEYGTRYAHRVVMMQYHVPIAGRVVRHTCDNPSCINVEHLTVGTQRDNVRDMFERGREPDRGRPYRVTDDLVRQVLSDHGSSRQTAKRVGLSPSTVSRIRRMA